MKKFELVRLSLPGRVNLPVYGTIELEKIDDELAGKLWRQGIPYLRPNLEHRRELFPEEKRLDPAPLPCELRGKKEKPAKLFSSDNDLSI